MMILQELNLISFGKFDKETIHLKEGLNIIYGDNESGKTTIHNFIDGMFYGFLKPYAKRRIYLEEYEKYRPWNREEYMGILKFTMDGKIYRIQRDFNKGQVWVYDDVTGKDITDLIDAGDRIKVHMPGIYFFRFNNLVYRNTISIRQLGNQVDSNLATEVKDRLANISTSLDDDISVKNAIKDLEKQLDEIGSKRAYTKPYGKALKNLEELEDKKRYLIKKQYDYDRYLEQSVDLDKGIDEANKRLEELSILLEKKELLDRRRKYLDALKIKEELKAIGKRLEELKYYSHLSIDDYSKALKLDTNIERVSEEIEYLDRDLDHIEEELRVLKLEDQEGIVEGIEVEKLYEDVELYDEMEGERNHLILDSNYTRVENLNIQAKGKIDKKNRLKTLNLFLIIFAVGGFGLGFINGFLFFLAIPLLGAALYTCFLKKGLGKEIDELKGQLDELYVQEEKKQKRLGEIENHQKLILSKYDCNSKHQLNRLRDEIYLKEMNQANRLDKINRLIQNREDMLKKLNGKVMDRQIWVEERDRILLKNKSKTLDEFNKGLENKNNYEALVMDKVNKMELLDKTLGDFSLEELKDTVEDYDDEYFKDIDGIQKDSITQEILQVKERLSHMINTKARLEERIEGLNPYIKELMEVEEEILRTNNLIEYYENRIKSIEIARDTIENISKEIHEQFAPAINKRVSGIMDFITDGRYDQVRINDDLNITVENPITKEIVDIDSLSGGTMDQLYFALRYSITSSMKTGNFPLILDDCFIQYDDERLENILIYLRDISQEKQILLFTCQSRERKILDGLELDYNLIQLT